MEVRTQIRPMERPPSQPTGRQRRDSRWPSGNSSGRSTRIRPSPGAQIHFTSQDKLRSQGERTGIREERIDCVLLSGAQEPIEEGGGQEDPADGVFGAVG